MFFERIFTDSLAHYSYMIGEGEEIVVIDPQPDIQVYLDRANEAGMKITKILETHRNEDFAVGSRVLSDITGAHVYISAHEDLDYKYGEKIKDGHRFEVENFKFEALHTPGHTLGHLSFVLYIDENKPYMIFTGDTLFAGDVGRTDFYGKDKLDEMTGKLYDSIFNKILPLGDHVILCPAHGAGSACGGNIENRPYTTIGYEKKYNSKLQYESKDEFIKNVGQMMHKPKYFNTIEEINLKGINRIDCDIKIHKGTIDDFEKGEKYLVDIRGKDAFCNNHIPNSLYIGEEELGSYIGLYVPTDANIYFITETQDKDQLNKLYLDLRRMGYSEDIGFLIGGMDTWYTNGKEVESIGTIHPKELQDKLDKDSIILDVRKEDELEDEPPIYNSVNIPLQELLERIEELSKDKIIYTVCSSGNRATVAAGLLKKENGNPIVLLGGIQGWNSIQ